MNKKQVTLKIENHQSINILNNNNLSNNCINSLQILSKLILQQEQEPLEQNQQIGTLVIIKIDPLTI